MSRKYFQNFPLINYDGHTTVNILRRVKLNENVKNFYTAFYPYTSKDGERIEDISFNYYEDCEYDWLIYHVNDVTDPYYGVALSSVDFDRYITKKYTSLRVAQQMILYYKNNWENDDQVISSSAYSALPGGLKRYWEPVYNYGDSVSGYARRQKDDIMSTNIIENVSFTTETSNTFVIGEWFADDNDATRTGTITWANTTVMTYQHVAGDFTGANTSITGQISGITAEINGDTVTRITNVIPLAEQVYYSPVTAYDFEMRENESKRDLQIVKNTYADTIAKQLKDILE